MPKILIFEDEKMLADMYATKLRMYGCDVAVYYNPTRDPVGVVVKEKPDLISSGIIMPVMDGFGALKRIKADVRTKHIPVVFLSNLGQKEDIEKGKSLGAIEYIVKASLTPTEVMEKFYKILDLPVPQVSPAAPLAEAQPQAKKHLLKKILKYFFTFQLKASPKQPPSNAVPPFSGGTPRPGLSFALWILVALLLIGYPANTIWRLLPFYADLWGSIEIVLVAASIIVGIQLLNRYPTALKNLKIFIGVNILYAIGIFVAYPSSHGLWEDINAILPPLYRMAILGSFVIFSRRGRELFPDAPIPRHKPWLISRRYFAGNMLGQIFTYGMIVLLIVAVITTPPSSPSDGSSKKDSAQERASNAWLEGHPDTLKQLMGAPSGIKPTLSTPAPSVAILDAKTIYEQKSPAVVFISTNKGIGSGFLLTADGVIATSQHVLNGSSDAVVMMKSGELHAFASVLSCDKNSDYCLFKIDVKNAPFLTLGDSSAVAVGDPVVVIGHPYGYKYTLSNGLISQIQDYDKAGTLFQFTAPTSPGNSGGPVFNQKGEVIGITNSLIASNDAQNLNFATAVSSLRNAFQP